jgi:8-oxo-dGTP diphosphatase
MNIKSFVLVENEGKYLLIREASFKWKGKWFLPGGNVKKGERPDLAVIREAKEEAGVDVELTGIFFVKCYQGTFDAKLHLFYKGRFKGGTLKQTADKHSLEANWFTPEEMRGLEVRQKLLKIVARYRKAKSTIPVKNFKLILFKSLIGRLGKAIGYKPE